MDTSPWEHTTERFVVFFDILGFKELVTRNSHEEVLTGLNNLKEVIGKLEDTNQLKQFKGLGVCADQTKSVTFSDSILFFSKGATPNDALKITFDATWVLQKAIEQGIAIKGAFSFGKVTVDFGKSLFFGQPIIDAYLLHEELQMLTVILDNHAEIKLRELSTYNVIKTILYSYKTPLRSGRITHMVIKPYGASDVRKMSDKVMTLYDSTYGKPRIYIDNTMEFLKSLPKVE